MANFEDLDLVDVAQGIAAKKFSSHDITAWSLNRLETIGRTFNAVFRIDHERALARAKQLDTQMANGEPLAPLHGVPLAHKDLLEVAGLEMHVGSKILRGNIASDNAWAINTLEAAGQVNLGALHMAEFAMSPTGFNAHYGHGLNPWNPLYACGGSSSGSGIAVAARLVFGSLGSDTGGSIRHPAAMCGVTGIKPTAGRVSFSGVFPLSHTLDCIGPLAQTARDCARILTHISQPNAKDPWCTTRPNEDYEATLDGNIKGLRIGVPQAYYRENLDPEVATALQASLEVLKGRGAQLVDVQVPDMAKIHEMTAIVLTVEAATVHQRWMQARRDEYGSQVLARTAAGFTHSAIAYREALDARHALIQDYLDTCFANCDVVHLPVLMVQTPTIASTTTGTLEEVLQSISGFTYANRAINYLGLPSMSVPAGLSSINMPLAFQLVGRHFEEARLLKVADAFQRDTDWHRKQPKL
jgi:aspartyl-tRNA(Asn)/glutamyl-tRNA(Gln) amidotransferase subunit A